MDDADSKELLMLRELAGGRCVISKVTAELGPLSLWSMDAFQRELARARNEALEEAAKVCEDENMDSYDTIIARCAATIRALKE